MGTNKLNTKQNVWFRRLFWENVGRIYLWWDSETYG